MRKQAWTVCATALGVMLWAAALARSGEMELQQRDGRTLKGEVIEVVGNGLKVKAQGVETVIPFDKLAPASVFEARRSLLDKGNIRGQVELGKYGVENSLFGEVRRLLSPLKDMDSPHKADILDLLRQAGEKQAAEGVKYEFKDKPFKEYVSAVTGMAKAKIVVDSNLSREAAKKENEKKYKITHTAEDTPLIQALDDALMPLDVLIVRTPSGLILFNPRLGVDKESVDSVGATLSGGAAADRIDGCAALGAFGEPEGARCLRPLLMADDERVRRAAVLALGELNDAGSRGPLLRALADKDVLVRRLAAWALRRTPSAEKAIEMEDEDIATYRKALKDSDSEVISGAAQALQVYAGSKSLDKLISSLLGSQDGAEARGGMNAAGWAGSGRCYPALRKKIFDKNQWVRAEAMRACVNMGHQAAVRDMIRALTWPEKAPPNVRETVCQCVGQLGGSDALKTLLDLAEKDETPSVRRAAASYLGRFYGYGDRAKKLCEKLLEDADKNVQYAAAQALCDLGDEETVPLLLDKLEKDKNWTYANALGRITGQGLGDDIAKWRDWWKTNGAKFVRERGEKKKE